MKLVYWYMLQIKIKFFILKVGHSWPGRLSRQRRKLQGRIWGMQPEVRRAFEKLRCSSIFNAFMFLEVWSLLHSIIHIISYAMPSSGILQISYESLVFSLYDQENTSEKWNIPWYTTREHCITMLYQNHRKYTWGINGKGSM